MHSGVPLALTRAPLRLAVLLVGPALFGLHAQEPKKQYAKGYLNPVDAKEVLLLIPPAPATGDPRDIVDQDVFLSTRKLKGSPRWALAIQDADLSAAGLMKAFACTSRTETPKEQPALAHLLERVSTDSFTLFGSLKNYYKRKRPFLINEGPTCVDPVELAKAYDYPSAHSILGYAAGLVLSEIDPQNASAILGRARQYGESRLFCGVHNASAVEAGRILGAALFAMLQDVPEFQKDLKAARSERRAPARSSCKAEAATLSMSPYTDLHGSAAAPAP